MLATPWKGGRPDAATTWRARGARGSSTNAAAIAVHQRRVVEASPSRSTPSDALNLAIRESCSAPGCAALRARRDEPDPRHWRRRWSTTLLRPLVALTEVINAVTPGTFSWTCVEADQDGSSPPSRRRRDPPETVLVAALYASNVTGTIQPRRVRICVNNARKPGWGVPLLVDAAQTLGLRRSMCRRWASICPRSQVTRGCWDRWAGGLYLARAWRRSSQPIREGARGARATDPADVAPGPYELGSQNAIGLAGLGEALVYLLERRLDLRRPHAPADAGCSTRRPGTCGRSACAGPAIGCIGLSLTHALARRTRRLFLEQSTASAGTQPASARPPTRGTAKGGGMSVIHSSLVGRPGACQATALCVPDRLPHRPSSRCTRRRRPYAWMMLFRRSNPDPPLMAHVEPVTRWMRSARPCCW